MTNVLITGASSGIGKEIANLFNNQGYTIITMGINKTDYNNYACDFNNYLEVKNVFKIILARHKIDILINCAGIYKENENMNNCDIYDMLNINLLSAWTLSNLFYEHTEHGNIINISSVNGITGKSVSDIYDMTKAAMNNMTLNHARRFANKWIRVNAICPSSTVTPMRDYTIPKNQRKQVDEHEISNLPIKRLGQPYDIAELALFLASNKASYITGQIIAVDGGWLLSKPQ